ncbi:hypothetical protein U1Q18_038922, partial [Sarracenia purpurea var. burkii]
CICCVGGVLFRCSAEFLDTGVSTYLPRFGIGLLKQEAPTTIDPNTGSLVDELIEPRCH